jgi:hypothetical protein
MDLAMSTLALVSIPTETIRGEENGKEEANKTTAIKVQQNVEKPNPMTVFGSGELELKVNDGAGRSFKGNAIFDVTSATA